MKRLLLAGAVALGLAAAALMLQTRSAPDPVTALPFGAVNAQETAEVDTSSIVEMALGSDKAAVTIVEYASFTCPHCANFHKDQFQRLKADFIDTGKIRFIYRDVYFDRYGLWASMVARCGGQARFFGISDMIYNQQRDWIGDGQDPVQIANNLRKIGKVAGLNGDQLEACLNDSDKAQALVAWYQANAEKDAVESTPTLIIHGQKYSNMAYDDLAAILKEKLGE